MPLRLPLRQCEHIRLPLRPLTQPSYARSISWNASSSPSSTIPQPEPVEPEPAKPDSPEIYDVVCVGGGPAGLSLLSALRSSRLTSHLKIALIDGQDLHKNQQQYANISGYSNRCSSLTPGSVGFLRDIGAWDHINASRTQPYHSMNVWDGVSGSSITFDPSSTSSSGFQQLVPTARSPPADIVATMTENNNITTALMTHLSTLPAVATFSPTRVEDISLGEETETMDLSSWPIVTLSNNQKLAARLLIGADGANSPVRTFAGIPSRGWDYERHGLVATLQLSQTPDPSFRTAYQRFLPTGPVALLPLPDKYASLVWSTTPANAAILKSLSPTDFVAMVNAAFRLLPVDLAYLHTISSDQLSEYEWREPATSYERRLVPPLITSVQDGTRASFPLRMRHADTYIGHRIALIGDAAHTIHPLAGQGLNQGLSDSRALSRSIEHAVSVGWDIGSSWALDGYEREQWGRNNAMLGAVDKLHKIYSAGSGPVVWARSAGLSAIDGLDAVKGWFMRRAAGVR